MQVNIKKILIISLSFVLCSFVSADEIFLSLKKNKVNVRYGPSFSSPIKFVYKKINLPLKQIDKKENWRRVVDLKNNSGWIHWSQLKPINSVINIENKILFEKPTIFSKPIAKIINGRLLVIEKCSDGWCKIKSDKYKGWIKNDNIWGLIN
tara:strand:+ start:1436 stop:1888 length:453 start_codon:yes stop_codon:yes gene_type:complete